MNRMAVIAEADEPKVNRTCNILKKYYQSFGIEYDAIFSEWCDDNGFDDGGVEDLFDDYEDDKPIEWMLADFDENDTFPFHNPPVTEFDKYRKIHKLLKKFWNNCGNPNISFNFAAKVPEFKEENFQITEQDLNNIKKIYKLQCPALFHSGMANDRCFLTLLAIGHKNNFNYLQCLVDDYFRDRINHMDEKDSWKVENWCQNHNHFKQLAKISIQTVQTECDLKTDNVRDQIKKPDLFMNQFQTIPALVSGAVKSFQSRVCPLLQFQPMKKINDSLDIVTQYIEAGFMFIATVLDEASQPKTKRAICPFQIDICIATNKPKDVQIMQNMHNKEAKNENEDDKDDKDDDKDDDDEKLKEDTTFVDCVGDIREKLETNNLKYKWQKVPVEVSNFEQGRVFITLFNQFEDKNNNDKYYYLHKKRLVALIDRRSVRPNKKVKKHDDEKELKDEDDVYLYEPPANCSSIPQNVVSEWYISASKTCLLPNIEYDDGKAAIAAFDKNNKILQGKITNEPLETKNIGSSFHCKQALLTISFHVKSTEEIKCYLYWSGQMTRFMPNDIKTVFPKLFNMDFAENRNFIASDDIDSRIQVMNNTLKDINFEGFQQSYM